VKTYSNRTTPNNIASATTKRYQTRSNKCVSSSENIIYVGVNSESPSLFKELFKLLVKHFLINAVNA